MYTNDEYLSLHPEWDGEDSALKSGWIREMIDKHRLPAGQIVEVGCGSGRILSALSQHYPDSVLKGYDISPDAIRIAKQFENTRVTFHQAALPENAIKADLLLLIDVLEHVPDYYGLLESIRQYAPHFIFHIPLDLSVRSLRKPVLMEQERKHSGHIHYFSKEMVLWTLRDAGYTVTDWRYTRPVCDLEPARGLKGRVRKLVRNVSFNLSKDKAAKWWGGYSMLIAAKAI